jgi:hypothetical protein
MQQVKIIGKVLLVSFGLCIWSDNVVAITFTTIDHPYAGNQTYAGTQVAAISGSKIVGGYLGPLNVIEHGFVYNGSTFTAIDGPPGSLEAHAWGVDGNNIVGFYDTGHRHGFLYNGSTYQTIDDPLGTIGSYAHGISGNKIVGIYQDSTYAVHSFLFNGSTYTTIDHPLARQGIPADGTFAYGIDGNNVVGSYSSSTGTHGFLYNGSTYQTLDAPLSAGSTYAYGIDGNNIVGSYTFLGVNHGFLYDGSTYITIDDPLGVGTYIHDIDGNNIVGTYIDSAQVGHGFIATIPEPSTLTLLGFWIIALCGYSLRRRLV